MIDVTPWKINMIPKVIEVWFKWFSFSKLGDFEVNQLFIFTESTWPKNQNFEVLCLDPPR